MAFVSSFFAIRIGRSCSNHSTSLARLSESRRVVPSAVRELARMVEPSGQFIWCLAREVEWNDSLPFDKYTLDVPPTDFLAVLDDPVWERILGTNSVPDSLHDRWQSEWDWDTHCRRKVVA